MEDFKFWANEQTSYFGDPGTPNRNDLKMDKSKCAMTIQQWENVKFYYTLVIILCYILIIVIILFLICFSCYEKHNLKKKHCRSRLNIEE